MIVSKIESGIELSQKQTIMSNDNEWSIGQSQVCDDTLKIPWINQIRQEN